MSLTPFVYVCRFECGVCQPTAKIQDRDRKDIISSLCLKFVILAVKAELDQLVEGLKTLDILTLVKNNPVSAKILFIHEPIYLTGESLYDMFRLDISNSMSNNRDVEEAQLLNWANFLEYVESKLNTCTSCSSSPP